jgi:hypothetical protein
MDKTTQINGHPRPGATGVAPKVGDAGKNGNRSSNGNGNGLGKREGIELFGEGRPRSTEELSANLAKLLGGTAETAPAETEAAADETSALQTEVAAVTEATENPEGETDPEVAAPETDALPEEDEETAPQEWPASAVAEVAKQRQKRRELKGEFEQLGTALAERTADVERLQQELEAARTQTPIAPTAENPLGNLTNETELARYAGQVRANVRLIEDYLDGATSPEENTRAEALAKSLGWNPEAEEKPDRVLKRLKRQGQDVLDQHVPQRAEALKAEKQASAQAEVILPFLKGGTDAESKELAKHARETLQAFPALRSIPNWKLASGVYALGLRELNRRLEAQKGGKGPAAAAAAAAKPVAVTVKPKVGLPGRSVTLPRQGGAQTRDAQVTALREKAFGKQGTKADVEEYLRHTLGTRN